jgi:hypothetical protein
MTLRPRTTDRFRAFSQRLRLKHQSHKGRDVVAVCAALNQAAKVVATTPARATPCVSIVQIKRHTLFSTAPGAGQLSPAARCAIALTGMALCVRE